MSISPSKLSRPVAICLACILVLYALYSSLLIYNSSVWALGQRWFCLLDDPMISMRYARNLALGHGLVWNPGERVEGITNPGWTFIMALVHLVEPHQALTSLYMQTASAFCIFGTIWITAHLAWRITDGSVAVTVFAAAFTAFYYPLNYWSLYGMETGLLALILTTAISMWYPCTAAGRFPWYSYLLLGIATFVRMDAAVPLMVIGGYGVLTAKSNWQRIQHFLWLCGSLLIFIGGQTLARQFYYGFPLPNTYFLKMTGFPVLQRMARGAYVTLSSVWYLMLPVFLLGGLIAAMQIAQALKQRKNISERIRDSRLWKLSLGTLLFHPVTLPALLFAAQTTYSIYVGGDAWEDTIYCNRYLVVAIPMVGIVNGWLVVRACHVMGKRSQLSGSHLRVVVAAALVVTGLFQVYKSVPSNLVPAILLAEKPPVQLESERSIHVVGKVKEIAEPDWVISCDWAGAVPYFIDHYTVDPLGKCDLHIARLPAEHTILPTWYKAFFPGHMKWDPIYTYRTYKPDLMIFFWSAGPGKDFKRQVGEHYEQTKWPEISAAIFQRLESR